MSSFIHSFPFFFFCDCVQVTGAEANVGAAKTKILAALDEYSENNHVLRLPVPAPAFPLIVGKKGATIQDLQSSSGARKIDLNREQLEIIIRGG
jgi:hypothetical protein